MGDSDLKGPLKEPPKLKKMGPKRAKIEWYSAFSMEPECYTDSSAIAIQCEYYVQVNNEKFRSMDP